MDWSTTEMVLDDTPIFMKRAVADSGCSMTGGPTSFGITRMTCVSPSCTCWRATMGSASRLKISFTDDRSVTDFERRMSTLGRPASACSMGMVTSASTSVGERPRHGVWISTMGGANSGKTSTGMLRIWSAPVNISAAAAASTMNRYLRLDLMIQRNMVGDLPVASVAVLVLGAHQLGGPDSDDDGARGRAVGEDDLVADDVRDDDLLTDERERAGAGEGPGLALGVVHDRAIGDGEAPLLLTDLAGLEADPLGRLGLDGDAHDALHLGRVELGRVVDGGDLLAVAAHEGEGREDQGQRRDAGKLHGSHLFQIRWSSGAVSVSKSSSAIVSVEACSPNRAYRAGTTHSE